MSPRHGTIKLYDKSQDLRGPDSDLEQLCIQLGNSKRIGALDQAQFCAELKAGKQYLKAPRARIDFIQELLVRPLKLVIEKEPLPVPIGVRAKKLLVWLLASLDEH